MFKKILIAEDYESANLSVQKVLEELNIKNVDHVYYCDDALAKIKKGIRKNIPYDLLITDLSFEEDHYTQKIKDGKELIKHIKREDPRIKVIVFSSENRSGIIDSLFNNYEIDGYVRKARSDNKDLKQAIHEIFNDQKYLTDDLQKSVKNLNAYELSTYDHTLISCLTQGILRKEIPAYLQKHNIKPNSLSSIEKRLNQIKESLNVANNEQLIAVCKDLGII
ncbi:response regulator [Chryseobacterium sp. CT-SW4]|uniref:response regulator n=1 Tax=Chryseobacterium sp. SW-1 TaxID=3157343 RepID=UPI003B01B382